AAILVTNKYLDNVSGIACVQTAHDGAKIINCPCRQFRVGLSFRMVHREIATALSLRFEQTGRSNCKHRNVKHSNQEGTSFAHGQLQIQQLAPISGFRCDSQSEWLLTLMPRYRKQSSRIKVLAASIWLVELMTRFARGFQHKVPTTLDEEKK